MSLRATLGSEMGIVPSTNISAGTELMRGSWNARPDGPLYEFQVEGVQSGNDLYFKNTHTRHSTLFQPLNIEKSQKKIRGKIKDRADSTIIVSVASEALKRHLVSTCKWTRSRRSSTEWMQSAYRKFFSFSHRVFLSFDHTWRRGFVARRMKMPKCPGHFGWTFWQGNLAGPPQESLEGGIEWLSLLTLPVELGRFPHSQEENSAFLFSLYPVYVRWVLARYLSWQLGTFLECLLQGKSTLPSNMRREKGERRLDQRDQRFDVVFVEDIAPTTSLY